MERFVHWIQTEESGQGMVEYGLILLVVAAVAVTALAGFGEKLSELFGQAADAFG